MGEEFFKEYPHAAGRRYRHPRMSDKLEWNRGFAASVAAFSAMEAVSCFKENPFVADQKGEDLCLTA